eukprot:CAMPEP_0171320746 /NCGR_PEP_ID=MMETSP0816-20121228/106737_1 /TAXON_ID=420281 /ORGANISM="Proboscia inermis, Strain CCAP1064/1" /LENGTH=101 /DNA_ID=CAMNT_0011817951 /DNA_START=29 /DNA_END=336 /DNA_ORIENTATION=-
MTINATAVIQPVSNYLNQSIGGSTVGDLSADAQSPMQLSLPVGIPANMELRLSFPSSSNKNASGSLLEQEYDSDMQIRPFHEEGILSEVFVLMEEDEQVAT